MGGFTQKAGPARVERAIVARGAGNLNRIRSYAESTRGVRPPPIRLSMSAICYMVIATLPDAATAAEYVAWLEDGHVDRVIDGGAHSAMIVRLDREAESPPRVMVQYIFPTRERFERYVSEFAPALRADGLKRFGPERGVRMERLIGDVA